MNVLVVGGGGREHAIIKALSQDSQATKLYLLPGRLSIKEAEGVPAHLLKEKSALAHYIREQQIELVIIGPEQPLVEGLGDFLRAEGVAVFGPSAVAAQLEGSKIFAKRFMQSLNIPTAPYCVVSSVSETLQMCEKFAPPYVLKADGLAGGKGVFVCKNQKELEEKAGLIFEKKLFAGSGSKALLENFQKGREISIFLLINGSEYFLLPVAGDYKRLYDGQKGPNTGGMGAIAPLTVPDEIMSNIQFSVIDPTVKGLKERGYDYRGVLYIGLMLYEKNATVLEYNVRFGDPEAQVLLPLLKGSWLEVFYNIAQGKSVSLNWEQNKVYSCLVLSARGYPEKPSLGDSIEGFLFHKTPYSYFIHGGIAKDEKGNWVTAGGRVLNAIAEGQTLLQARERVYKQAERMSWKGMHFRKDIGLVSEGDNLF